MQCQFLERKKKTLRKKSVYLKLPLEKNIISLLHELYLTHLSILAAYNIF